MKFGVVNKSTTVNRFVRHTLHRNIRHLAIITRKTNIKLGVLKEGTGKEPHLAIIIRNINQNVEFFELWGKVEKSQQKNSGFTQFWVLIFVTFIQRERLCLLKTETSTFLRLLVPRKVFATSFWIIFEKMLVRQISSFSLTPPPTSHELQYISVTSGFTRLSMTTKYVCRGLISLYVNFHNKWTMWSTNLLVKICRWGEKDL